jgi:hypothetical protein
MFILFKKITALKNVFKQNRGIAREGAYAVHIFSSERDAAT